MMFLPRNDGSDSLWFLGRVIDFYKVWLSYIDIATYISLSYKSKFCLFRDVHYRSYEL